LVLLSISYGCQVRTKAHRNGTSEEFRKTSDNDEAGRPNAVNESVSWMCER